MHGRATSVVLPALIVLALVAVVAIASTGSTPSGTGETRRPSDSLFDTLYSLGIAGILLGLGLFLYGLTQARRMSRDEAAKQQRLRLLGFIVFMAFITLFGYLRMRNLEPPAPPEAEESAFPGELPTPTTPETNPTQTAPYEPSIAWIPIAIVLGLVAFAVVAYIVSERNARRARRSRTVLAAELALVLEETLDDLRAEADPRKAIIAAYARLERVLALNGVPRRSSETPDEYLPRVLRDLDLDPHAVERLTTLFARAKFSQHDVDTAMKEEAIGALEHVRDELRLAREKPAEIDAPATFAGAPS